MAFNKTEVGTERLYPIVYSNVGIQRSRIEREAWLRNFAIKNTKYFPNVVIGGQND